MVTLSKRPEHALASLIFLAGVPADTLEQFAASVRWIDAGPDEIVVDFDDPTTDVFFVVQGIVRVQICSSNGEHTQILGDFAVGDLVGELSAIDDLHRSAQVKCLVRTCLCVMPATTFLDLAFASRGLGLRLLRLLTARIREQTHRLLEYTALPMRLRLAAELLRLSRLRSDGMRILSPPPTQEELAARIGTRRETISRELSALTDAGLLRRTRGALVLNDPAALQAVVEAKLNQTL